MKKLICLILIVCIIPNIIIPSLISKIDYNDPSLYNFIDSSAKLTLKNDERFAYINAQKYNNIIKELDEYIYTLHLPNDFLVINRQSDYSLTIDPQTQLNVGYLNILDGFIILIKDKIHENLIDSSTKLSSENDEWFAYINTLKYDNIIKDNKGFLKILDNFIKYLGHENHLIARSTYGIDDVDLLYFDKLVVDAENTPINALIKLLILSSVIVILIIFIRLDDLGLNICDANYEEISHLSSVSFGQSSDGLLDNIRDSIRGQEDLTRPKSPSISAKQSPNGLIYYLGGLIKGIQDTMDSSRLFIPDKKSQETSYIHLDPANSIKTNTRTSRTHLLCVTLMSMPLSISPMKNENVTNSKSHGDWDECLTIKEIARVLENPKRRLIIRTLKGTAMTLQDLAKETDISDSTLSDNLNVLIKIGLIKKENERPAIFSRTKLLEELICLAEKLKRYRPGTSKSLTEKEGSETENRFN